MVAGELLRVVEGGGGEGLFMLELLLLLLYVHNGFGFLVLVVVMVGLMIVYDDDGRGMTNERQAPHRPLKLTRTSRSPR